jgi:hypothetical protein
MSPVVAQSKGESETLRLKLELLIFELRLVGVSAEVFELPAVYILAAHSQFSPGCTLERSRY